MPPEQAIRVWTMAGLALLALGLGALLVLARRGAPAGANREGWEGRKGRPHRAEWVEWLVCLALLAVGAYLRISGIGRLHDGRLTQDEAYVDRLNLFEMLSRAPSSHGATYLVHARLLDLWQHVVGFGPLSGRSFSAAMGALGLVFFFLALRATLGLRPALWASALLAVALQAVYFATIALETINALAFLPLLAWLATRCHRRPSWGRGLALGAVLGLSFFTYPGVLVALAAFAAAWLVAAAPWRASRAGRLPERVPWPALLGCALSCLALLATGIGLHRRYYGVEGGHLFRGGGGLDPSLRSWADALAVLLHDAFVETTTWNLIHRHAPFVEWTFWPLVLAGGVVLWRSHANPAARALVLCMPIALVMVPFTGAYPGMRRGLFLLLPVTALAGLGAAWIFRRLGPLWGALLLGALLAHTLVYQLTFGGRLAQRASLGSAFSAEPIPDALLLERLRQHDVVVSADEFLHPWDRGRLRAFVYLARRYGQLELPHDVRLLAEGDPAFVASLTDGSGALAATWQPAALLERLERARPLCFGLVRVADADGPALLRLATPEAASPQDGCPAGTHGRFGPTPCARLGSARVDSMVAHRVRCVDAGCTWPRTDWVYVHPGSVTLELEPPPDAREGPVWIVFKVLHAQVERRTNGVALNGEPIGVLDASLLRPGALAALAAPPAARAEGGPWTVGVGPGPRAGATGWDLFWVALVKGGPEERLDDAIARVERESCGPP